MGRVVHTSRHVGQICMLPCASIFSHRWFPLQLYLLCRLEALMAGIPVIPTGSFSPTLAPSITGEVLGRRAKTFLCTGIELDSMNTVSLLNHSEKRKKRPDYDASIVGMQNTNVSSRVTKHWQIVKKRHKASPLHQNFASFPQEALCLKPSCIFCS